MARDTDLLLGAVLGAGATLLIPYMMVCARAVYFAFRRLHQCQNRNQIAQNEPIEAECTCDEQHRKCEQHDEKLLSKISNIVTSYGDMMDFGLVLNLKRKFIEKCRKKNRSCIKSAVLEMLQNWYDRQPDFKASSEAVVKL